MTCISLSEKFCCQNFITSMKVIDMTGHSSKTNTLRNINKHHRMSKDKHHRMSNESALDNIILFTRSDGDHEDYLSYHKDKYILRYVRLK